MSARLLTVSRWALAALFLSFPVALMTLDAPSGSELVPIGLFLSPWALAALGLAFRVPAARGFALGVSILSLVTFCLANGFEMPDGWRDALLLTQGFGLLLALPAFGKVFGDNLRLRWTAAAVGFAIPAAVLFAVFAASSAQVVAWSAIAFIGLGVIGLAFQRTWSLFAFLAGALAVGATPFIVDQGFLHVSSVEASVAVGWIAGIALLSTWLPWMAPMFRKLRG